MEFANLLRTPYFTEHLQWLLLAVSGFQPANLLKKDSGKDAFSMNFAKFQRYTKVDLKIGQYPRLHMEIRC